MKPGARLTGQLRRCQAPASRQGRPVDTADKDVVVHVPNGGLTRVEIIKQNIGAAVTVEIGRSHKEIARPWRWDTSINIVVHIKDKVMGEAQDRGHQVIRV